MSVAHPEGVAGTPSPVPLWLGSITGGGDPHRTPEGWEGFLPTPTRGSPWARHCTTDGAVFLEPQVNGIAQPAPCWA